MKPSLESKIYVAGHSGMVGSAICRRLKQSGYHNLVVRDLDVLDLKDQSSTSDFFNNEKPEYVFMAAGKAGDIRANTAYPADMLYENLLIQNNTIHAAHQSGVTWSCFLSSSSIYPRDCIQPMREEYLNSGPPDSAAESYAIAHRTGIELCNGYNKEPGTRFVSAITSNLYGPNDDYGIDNSHVIPALIRKIHDAKMHGDQELVVSGFGSAKQEFLNVDDMAAACVHLMEQGIALGTYNIGSGVFVTIESLARIVAQVVGFTGHISLDASKTTGALPKLLDVSKLSSLGWEASTTLLEGVGRAYEDFILHTRFDQFLRS